jgi:Cft2 family RNA processing exonuclease
VTYEPREPQVSRSAFGLHVAAADLYLDSRRAPGLVFVSHAHSDHCSNSARIVCTPETAALHPRRKVGSEATTLRYGEHISLGGATLELVPAGHTLGSAMAVVRAGSGTLVYTGDYKLRAGAFSSGLTAPRCDTLVMECTFGDPRYRFPPEREVLARLFAFVDQTLADGAIPVVCAYAFGKAQEALYHFTAAGYTVAVQDAVASVCEKHVALGYEFPLPGTWTSYGGGVPDAQVILTTPGAQASLGPRFFRTRVAYLTGWAMHPAARWRFRDCDLLLPLSGHADFEELVRTATESGARKVYTVHGSRRFAAHLRTLGIDAEHLGPHPHGAMRDGTIVTAPSTAAPTQLSLELT